MKRIFLVFSLLAGWWVVSTVQGAVEMPASSYLKGVTWLGHASFRIARGGVVIYIDPWRLSSEPHDADILLITHSHFDHLSPADVLKIVKPDTEILTVKDGVLKLKEAGVTGHIRQVEPGDRVVIKGISIEAVPAYNTNKTFHLKENNWVGYIVQVDGVRIYHAGDTDLIPEMKTFNVDVALLPVSGKYVMTAVEAARAAKLLHPKVAVPMHYGSIVGSVEDAKQFQKLCSEMVVEILGKDHEQ